MSERLKTISKLKENSSSRIAYIRAKLNVLIPSQIKALRLKSGMARQEDLAQVADMKQSRISAMETPGAVNFNLETLVRLASAFKVGLIVKFVPFSEMLRWENKFKQDDFSVAKIDEDVEFLTPAAKDTTVETSATAVSASAIQTSLFQTVLFGGILHDASAYMYGQAFVVDPSLPIGQLHPVLQASVSQPGIAVSGYPLLWSVQYVGVTTAVEVNVNKPIEARLPNAA